MFDGLGNWLYYVSSYSVSPTGRGTACMFSPSSLDQQLAATWNAARTDRPRDGVRPRHTARRPLRDRLVRVGR